MSVGYPDFFGQQAFSKFGTFNVHGPIATSALTPGGVTVEVATGKGKTYGGFIWCYPVTTDGTDFYPGVIIDDVATDFLSPVNSLKYGTHLNDYQPLKIVQYDIEEDDYIWAIAPNWTFSESYKVRIFNNTGVQFNAIIALYWAKVTG